MLSLNQVSDYAKSLVDNTKDIEKFIQELAWRDFWQRIYYHYPDYITDIEPYKTGFLAADYQQVLPTDIDDARYPKRLHQPIYYTIKTNRICITMQGCI